MSALPNWVKDLKGWLNAALALVYPEICQLCGQERASPAQGFVCADCRAQARFIEPPFCERCGRPYPGDLTGPFECADCLEAGWAFRSARSAVVARDTVLEVIHRYKYGRALWLEPFLAGLLISRAAPALAAQSWHALVPVPLHPTRQRQREFNQAERLARRLSQATRIPLNRRLLRRVAPTRTQALLSRRERLANVRAAFAIRPGHRLEGQRLVLIDDVMTTGATTGACAAVLRAAGAAEVCVWTVARGI
jgi:ComF family protein